MNCKCSKNRGRYGKGEEAEIREKQEEKDEWADI